MSASWDLAMPSTEKMVLMCLCDYANDDGGSCWPSVATLARKCSKSERTIQGAIKSLQEMGYLTAKGRAGTSNLFQLNPRKICAPAESAPPQKTANTPAESAPNPSRTTNNNIKRAIPANWQPEEFGTGSKSRPIVDGWSSDDLAAQLEQFKANHKSKGNKFCDPQAAWSTWVLNSVKFKPRNGNNGYSKPTGTATAAQRALAIIDGRSS